jgi:hypothetical protein
MIGRFLSVCRRVSKLDKPCYTSLDVGTELWQKMCNKKSDLQGVVFLIRLGITVAKQGP